MDTLIGPGNRLYQAELFAKYAGTSDYEQPLHIDETNHTLLPPRRDGMHRQVQLFVYLSDVTADLGPTHVVSNKHTAEIPREDLWFHRAGPVHLDEHEVAATGPALEATAYRYPKLDLDDYRAAEASDTVASNPPPGLSA